MTKIKKSTSLAAALILANSLYGVDLDTISVESSTIKMNESSKTEVSTENYISEETIKDIAPKNLNEVLQGIPGITSDVRPGEVVEIHIRGVNQQEFMWEDTGVAVIIDGVPVWQNGGKFRINMNDIKSIKVIKGAASYLYGNNALAGAVIINTSKPKGIKNSYELSTEFGSFKYKNYSASLLRNTDNYGLNLNANYRSTDGYWVDSSLWSKSITGRYNYYLDDSSDIALGADITKKFEESNRAGNTGVTQAELTPEGSGRNSFKKDNMVDLDKYYLNYTKTFDNDFELTVNSYYYNDLYDFISSPQDTNSDGENDTYSKHTNEDIIQKGVKLELNKDDKNLAYMVGLEYGSRDYEDSAQTLIDYTSTSRGVTTNYYAGENSNVEDSQIKNAIYGELKYKITPKLITTINARYDLQEDTYDISNTDYDGTNWSNNNFNRAKDYKEASYRLGFSYLIDDTTSLYSNISTGFRTPTVDQLYAGDIRSGVYLNNESLKVQDTISYELGIRNNFDLFDIGFKSEVAIFQTNNNNIIGRNEGTYFSGSSIYFDNVGDARNRGLELSLKSDPSKDLSFNLSYTYLKSEYTKHNPYLVALTNLDSTYNIVGNELPRVPNHTIDLFATYKLTENTKLIGELYAISDYYIDETNQTKMGGYSNVNLQLRHTTKINKHNFEFFVKVNNIFDNQYYQTIFMTSDRNGDDVLDAEDATITVNPGREFYAGLIYRF